MTQQATWMTTHKLSIAGSDLPGAVAPLAPAPLPSPAAGTVQII